MNAKDELISDCNVNNILCAEILRQNEDYEPQPIAEFKITDTDINPFLDKLDFEYDDGYGGQELFGTVWLKDGTWLERYEYDGAECWHHKKCPKIPDYLNQ